ncbi:hypothetical protein TorRG33x02_319670, partial [Trema orientale]
MGNGLSGAVDKQLQVAGGMKRGICFGMLWTTLNKISDFGIGTCPHSSTCIDRSQLFISLLFHMYGGYSLTPEHYNSWYFSSLEDEKLGNNF